MNGVMTLTVVLALAAEPSPRGQELVLHGLTFNSGGTLTTTGDGLELSLTIGEAVVGTTEGPQLELAMGFWAVVTVDATTDGDFDGDGDVDLTDFAQFGQCFGGANNPPAPSCPPGVDADFDEDGDVDLSDFAVFAQNFTGAQ